MILVSIIILMIVAIFLGRQSGRAGFKQYFVIFLITLLQVAIALYKMYTMEMPPLN